MAPRARGTRLTLRTFAAPALVRSDGSTMPGLRRKDIALLVFLRLEPRSHTRSVLTALLWDGTEETGRHSLTQAIVRLRSVLGPSAIRTEHDHVALRAELPCDAPDVHDESPDAELLMSVASVGPDRFLAELQLPDGARDFDAWADEKRAQLRRWLLRHLDVRSADAERQGRFGEARELALLMTRIEPYYEEGHRRIMRAWSAVGERVLALRQYEQLSRWLATECGEHPDPATRQLADLLR
jgi:DNA-binding SARP family transcriptional activator